MSERRRRLFSPWTVIGLSLLALGILIGIAFRDQLVDPQCDLLIYAAVGLFGLAVGSTELAARYRDKPQAPFATIPGWIYILTNALAAIVALWFLREVAGENWLGGSGLPVPVAQVLVAGFGAMAFFRSSFFNVQIDGNDVPVGPAAVLLVILEAADRACDRQRALPRSTAIREIMKGVAFNRAKDALPLYCFELMQNVSIAEQHRLTKNVDALSSAGMEDEVKSFNLGLFLLNVVGEEVLRKAVKDLGGAIRGPVADRAFLSQMAGSIDRTQIDALVEMCGALDPLPLDRSLTEIRAEIDEAIKTGAPTNSKEECLIALTVLHGYYGRPTLEAALRTLGDDF